MNKLIKSYIISMIAISLSAYFMDSITIDSFKTLIVVVLVISILHFLAFKVLILASGCFILMTMGIGLFIIDASIFYITSNIVYGFYVASFWSAFKLSLIVILFNSILHAMTKEEKKSINKTNTDIYIKK